MIYTEKENRKRNCNNVISMNFPDCMGKHENKIADKKNTLKSHVKQFPKIYVFALEIS